jgi:hypothetical protein
MLRLRCFGLVLCLLVGGLLCNPIEAQLQPCPTPKKCNNLGLLNPYASWWDVSQLLSDNCFTYSDLYGAWMVAPTTTGGHLAYPVDKLGQPVMITQQRWSKCGEFCSTNTFLARVKDTTNATKGATTEVKQQYCVASP